MTRSKVVCFNVSTEIVTPESAENGDTDEEQGWVEMGLTLREAVTMVHEVRTSRAEGVQCIECDSSPAVDPRWVTVVNGMEFETGAQESRSLHMPRRLTASTRRRIARLVGARVP